MHIGLQPWRYRCQVWFEQSQFMRYHVEIPNSLKSLKGNHEEKFSWEVWIGDAKRMVITIQPYISMILSKKKKIYAH